MRLAETVFVLGRSYGRCEAGAADDVDLPEGPERRVAAQLCANPDLGRQLVELRAVALGVVQRFADLPHDVVCQPNREDLLSRWEGFAKFSEEDLGLAAATVLPGFRLGEDEPASELKAASPGAVADAAAVENWHHYWSALWRRQFCRPV